MSKIFTGKQYLLNLRLRLFHISWITASHRRETLHITQPPHSEANKNIIDLLCASSPMARNKFEEALEETPSGAFWTLEYSELIEIRDYRSGTSVFHPPTLTPTFKVKYLKTLISVAIVPALSRRSTFDSDNPTKDENSEHDRC